MPSSGILISSRPEKRKHMSKAILKPIPLNDIVSFFPMMRIMEARELIEQDMVHEIEREDWDDLPSSTLGYDINIRNEVSVLFELNDAKDTIVKWNCNCKAQKDWHQLYCMYVAAAALKYEAEHKEHSMDSGYDTKYNPCPAFDSKTVARLFALYFNQDLLDQTASNFIMTKAGHPSSYWERYDAEDTALRRAGIVGRDRSKMGDQTLVRNILRKPGKYAGMLATIGQISYQFLSAKANSVTAFSDRAAHLALHAAYYAEKKDDFHHYARSLASNGLLVESPYPYFLKDLDPVHPNPDKLNEECFIGLVAARIYHALFSLVELPHHMKQWADSMPKKGDPLLNAETAKALVHYYYFKGQLDKISLFSAYLPEYYEAFLVGAKLISAEKTEEALRCFEAGDKVARKLIGKKTLPISLNGWLFALALCKVKPDGFEKKATTIAKSLATTDGLFINAYCGIMALLSQYELNESDVKMYLNGMSIKLPLHRFMHVFIKFVVSPQKVNVEELKVLSAQAKIAGYAYIEDEIYLISKSVLGDQVSLEPTKLCLNQYWSTLFPKQERWRNALELLSNISTTGQTGKVESNSRIVFLVDFKRQDIEIKQQTYSKGSWTGGKKVSFKRFKAEDIPGKTEQDIRISSEYTLDYYDTVRFKPTIWKAICGHPLLFLMESPEISVQLISEAPVLQAQQTKNGFVLQMVPPLPPRNSVPIIKETPTRYKYIDATEKHYLIYDKILQEKLVIPQEGEAMLQQSLIQLSGVIPVQSSLLQSDESLNELPTDSRICLHVLPVGDRFHIEMYVRPFGKVPPYLSPGVGEEQIIGVVDSKRTVVKRKLKAELAEAKLIKSKLAVLQEKPAEKNTWHLEDTEACLSFLTDVKPLLDTEALVLEWPQGERMKIQRVVGFDQFKIQVGSANDWFEVSGSLQIDENKVLTLQELLKLTEQKSQFIELGPGNFLAITNELRKRLKAINALMQPGKKGVMHLHPLAASALSPILELTNQVTLDKKFKESEKRAKSAFSAQFEVPSQFNADLRPYQKEGFTWLHRCAAWGVGALLADDMGLGKTIQALAFLTDRAPLGPALVVAPASVARNWFAECTKFAPQLTPILFGEGDRAEMIQAAKTGELIITTYDLLVRASAQFQEKKFATIILDEAQAIKNRATKRSETVMQLQTDFRLVMSGTPVENHLGELWNLFQFANPGLLGSIDSFNERFAIPIEKYKDENRRDQLKRLIQPFILRRRKDEVLKDLPAKTEIVLTVQLSDDERAFYEVIRRKALEALMGASDAKGGEKHLQILAEIMRLRRAACHPELVDENAGFKSSSKLQLFSEIVDELVENGHRALVFSQFVGHLSILRKHLDEKGVAYQYLDGQTPLPKRQEYIQAFQDGTDTLFLISLKAGGTGLNLTAADYVLHMDPWWNPAVEDQATDRAHRIGQLKPVTVYRFVAENTIEEKILKLHDAKRNLADSLLSGADVSAKLNYDDLLNLLKEE
jgi:SNF2 family DNA or RNA helicase